jgi:shikimate kinase
MILKLARTPGIYLVGFMGCGKTTVGRLLADRLGWDFVDLDAEIEAEQKMPIAEIFDRLGEEHFRKLEADAVRQRVRMIQSGRPMVVALGGGAFAQPSNFELLEHNGVSLWLDCPLDILRQRLSADTSRPLARDPQKFQELFEARLQSYACADYRIQAADEAPEGVVEAILRLPIF